MPPPLAVLSSGFLHSSTLGPVIDEMERRGFEVRVKLMPGHGAEPSVGPLTVDALASYFADWIAQTYPTRELIFVGESLSGLAGMAMAAFPPKALQRVFAIDPPLSTLKHSSLRHGYDKYRHNMHPLMPDYADVFGIIIDDGNIVAEERDYSRFLSGAKVPVHILAGGRTASGRTPGSLLDAGDRDMIRCAKGYTLHEMASDIGHLVLVENLTRAVDVVVENAAPFLRTDD